MQIWSAEIKDIEKLCESFKGHLPELARMRTCGYNVNVKWHYKEDDDDMLDAGKEMSGMAKLPFSFIQIKV